MGFWNSAWPLFLAPVPAAVALILIVAYDYRRHREFIVDRAIVLGVPLPLAVTYAGLFVMGRLQSTATGSWNDMLWWMMWLTPQTFLLLPLGAWLLYKVFTEDESYPIGAGIVVAVALIGHLWTVWISHVVI